MRCAALGYRSERDCLGNKLNCGFEGTILHIRVTPMLQTLTLVGTMFI